MPFPGLVAGKGISVLVDVSLPVARPQTCTFTTTFFTGCGCSTAMPGM